MLRKVFQTRQKNMKTVDEENRMLKINLDELKETILIIREEKENVESTVTDTKEKRRKMDDENKFLKANADALKEKMEIIREEKEIVQVNFYERQGKYDNNWR